MESRNSHPHPGGPYQGVRVIDFTHVLSGPFCSYQLALMGADVIKIEEPGRGDYMRRRGSDERLRDQLMGDHFLSLNANKRSLALDLGTEAGVAIARRLILGADVVIENFRAGVMDALGIGYEALSTENPRLIYCAVSGFGRSGADASRKAYDQVVQATSGMMSGNGQVGGDTIKTGSPVLDYSSGIMAAFAIASALFQRATTGRGEMIDVAMHDTALMLQSTGIMNQLRSGKAPSPHGNNHPLAAATGYRAADGQWIMLGCCTQRQFERLCALIGRPDILLDPRFADVNIQDSHRSALARELEAIMATKTADEWEQLLADHVPVARAKSLQEGIDMARNNGRTVVQPIIDPVIGEEIEVPVAAFGFTGANGPSLRSFPPRLGEHTTAVLGEIGYSREDIAALIESKAVAAWVNPIDGDPPH